MDNSYLPTVFKDHIQEVTVFEDFSDVLCYLSTNLSYDSFWDFGIKSVDKIELGKVYINLNSESR